MEADSDLPWVISIVSAPLIPRARTSDMPDVPEETGRRYALTDVDALGHCRELVEGFGYVVEVTGPNGAYWDQKEVLRLLLLNPSIFRIV